MPVCVLAALVAATGVPAAADGPRPTISLARTPFVFGAGGVGASMDAVPFYDDGVWHLFHMQTEPRGIAHRASRDLVNWEVRPLAIPGDAAPGNVVEHGGRFYTFYTVNQTIHAATSEDLNTWTPAARNPVAVADGEHYIGPNFRDAYVFRNDEESCWWMLVATEVPGPMRFRAGCVGLYKSTDLLEWRPAEPLWSPGVGPRHECPQVIREGGKWYLFDLERQTQYRVAKSLCGPWLRPPGPYLDSHTALAGSRLETDGKRWVSFPFLCAQQGDDDFGDVVQAEVYAIPRQLDFDDDGRITERPVVELIDAMHALPPIDALSRAAPVSGRWELDEDQARSAAPSGTLLLRNAPADLYLEAEITLERANMEASIRFRVDPELTRGYKLTFEPSGGLVTLRPFSYWDRDRVLLARPFALPAGRPFTVRVFLSGTVVEAFVDDRIALSTRVYRHRDGGVVFEAVDGAARFDHVAIHALERG